MNCTNCGTVVATDERFCANCGLALVDDRTRQPNVASRPPVAPPRTSGIVRNPGVALLLSAIIPGAGQIYNGAVGKGIGMFIAYALCWSLSAFILPVIGIIGIWVWAVIDAYQTAKASAG